VVGACVVVRCPVSGRVARFGRSLGRSGSRHSGHRERPRRPCWAAALARGTGVSCPHPSARCWASPEVESTADRAAGGGPLRRPPTRLRPRKEPPRKQLPGRERPRQERRHAHAPRQLKHPPVQGHPPTARWAMWSSDQSSHRTSRNRTIKCNAMQCVLPGRRVAVEDRGRQRRSRAPRRPRPAGPRFDHPSRRHD
jgi:hypothetical protein